ncbi:phosphoribosylaminoimidazole-succinocarboxamide synthase [Methylobacterium indicum]|uniref:Phosphoribosylaminoimidazole-succinocarboxamide synthase n=2 Tax=Methylobacterium indicum TaxID=1775910 RepID=A0A8H8WTF6_9HYPH|nr:phosphoribosylaminoimidazole-succinocarboxamide synthase [Methylobacterium indicum]
MVKLMDTATLAPFSDYVLPEATLPELPGHYRGKVRDNYDLPDGRRILITSDRLSAFDRELAAIPLKGQVLTQTARYWFEKTRDICDNHVLAYPDPNVVVGRRLTILPVEIVVRGYLAGSTGTSVLTLYKAGQREMYGHRLPDGMRPHEALPQPIITPTTKAGHGDHDAPLSAAEILERGLLTEAQWHTLSEVALALFARGQALAAERGLILADTKYEFGTDADGRIVLADEIHTPDSSRYWFAQSYAARFEAGTLPESFDKDVVRNWVAARCDPYRDAVPAIPPEVVLQTAATYVSAFEAITGERFPLPDTREAPLERIRRNIAAYLAA